MFEREPHFQYFKIIIWFKTTGSGSARSLYFFQRSDGLNLLPMPPYLRYVKTT